jgi:hypothetical protein
MEGNMSRRNIWKLSRRSASVVWVFFVVFGAVVQADVIQVTTTQDNVPGSLRAAITTANSNNGDYTIQLPAGTYILDGGPEDDANASGDLDIDSSGEITITGAGADTTIIDGNQQDRVFHILNGKVSISGVTIQNGRTIPPSKFWVHNRDGGGIYNSAILTLNDCVIRNNQIGTPQKLNTRGDGGGIYNNGVLTIAGCTVENNIAGYASCAVYCTGPGGFGGGIYNSNSLTIIDSRICNNKAGDGGMPGVGGGIYNSEEGTASLTDCTISGNFNHDGRYGRGGCFGGDGGGIYNKGKLTLSGCTISGNRTGSGGVGGLPGDCLPGRGGFGAGIFQAGEKEATLINCTISNNSTGNGGNSNFSPRSGGSGGYGGGIYNESTMTLINCTICNNSTGAAGKDGSETEYEPATGGWGGGIYNSGTQKIQNTIVANNQVSPNGIGPDCSGSFFSLGYNLVEINEGFTFTGDLTGNKIGVDPRLAALADNGGPTMTYALEIDSPAVDAGSSAGISTDQRGLTRPVDIPGITNAKDGADIGAFELSTPYYIAGRIASGSTGVPGVALFFSNGAGTSFTDAKGYYSHPIDPGWSGTVTPSRDDYSFTPSNRSYHNVHAAVTGQDFTAKPYPVSVTITRPVDGSTVSGKVIIEAAVSSHQRQASVMAISKVEFYIDGKILGEVSAPPCQYSWNSGLSGNGSHTIKVKAYNAASQTSEDEITVIVSNTCHISVNRSQLNFVYFIDVGGTFQQEFLITNSGSGILNWTIRTDRGELRCSPTSGTNSAVITVTFYYSSEMPRGLQTGTIIIESPDADNSPQTVTANLEIRSGNKSKPPFGRFDTPIARSTIMSSVPFTGWVLDDIAVDRVEIYREPVPGEGNRPVFIGSGTFVEGARPDIEKKYPDYPNNYKAGWGYMMLTNFLPGGGNGYFTFHVVAIDFENHRVTLGSKTVFCDNQNAVKPFGAIDTPEQGGTAWGSDFVNFAWALTPLPNTIPKDGSTINVWVDGVPLGNPVYNRYRSDIAGLFPGYNNSNGAGGHFYLDTTPYENGLHTIAWSVKDNAGNIDGIGSRYFTISNTGGTASVSQNRSSVFKGEYSMFNVDISQIPLDDVQPIYIKKGYNQNIEPKIIYPDSNGNITIEIKELQRLEVHFPGETRGFASLSASSECESSTSIPAGFQLIGERPAALPIGSFLDSKNGIFSWQPGPGYLGDYELVFIEKIGNELNRKLITVRIKPRFE